MNKSYIIKEIYSGMRIDRWIKNNIASLPQSLIEKSLNEIKEVLNGMSLYLGMEIPNWPPDNIAELSKKLEESM